MRNCIRPDARSIPMPVAACEEGQPVLRGLIQFPPKYRVQRWGQLRACLDLAQLDPARPDVLPPHAHDIAAPLARVEQQGQRQPFPGP